MNIGCLCRIKTLSFFSLFLCDLLSEGTREYANELNKDTIFLKWFILLMSAYVHCFSHLWRSSTKWRVLTLFTMGSTIYFELFSSQNE